MCVFFFLAGGRSFPIQLRSATKKSSNLFYVYNNKSLSSISVRLKGQNVFDVNGNMFTAVQSCVKPFT